MSNYKIKHAWFLILHIQQQSLNIHIFAFIMVLYWSLYIYSIILNIKLHFFHWWKVLITFLRLFLSSSNRSWKVFCQYCYIEFDCSFEFAFNFQGVKIFWAVIWFYMNKNMTCIRFSFSYSFKSCILNYLDICKKQDFCCKAKCSRSNFLWETAAERQGRGRGFYTKIRAS